MYVYILQIIDMLYILYIHICNLTMSRFPFVFFFVGGGFKIIAVFDVLM